MAYKQSPGRMNMPKTGRDIPTNMVNPNTKQTVSEKTAAASRAKGKMASVKADIKAGKHKPGKKVKVTTSSGKQIELDTRSSSYKALQQRKAKKENKPSKEFKNVAISKDKTIAMEVRG
jgi:hypothetical protein